MVDARRYAEIVLQNDAQDEFLLDLVRRDHTFHKIVAAFEALGCTVDCPGEDGKMVVKRPGIA